MEQNEILEQEIDETQKYIDAIQEMKKTSVSREDYDRLRDENTKLLNSLVNGQTYENTSTEVTKPNVEELRKEWGKESSNLKFWENTLNLRDAIMAEGGKDPFLPYGQKIQPTEEDVLKAEKVASVIRECIDYADGDSAIFTNELQRKTLDVAPARSRK